MRLHIKFSEGQCFTPQFSDTNQHICLKFREMQVIRDYDWWTGLYDIVPRVSSQEFATKDKTMAEDLLVEGIPVQRVINTSGGITAVIGGI